MIFNFIVLSIGDVFEGILIVVIILVAIIFFAGIIPQWLSHMSGYGIRTRYGGKIADPSDWNNTKEGISILTKNIKETSVGVYEKIRKYNSSYSTRIQDKNEQKLDKLYIINDLKEKGIITHEEFDKLKKEILN